MKKKQIILLVVIVILITILTLVLLKQTKKDSKGITKDLFDLEEEYFMNVAIYFDKTKPDVVFINPKGEKIGGEHFDEESGEDWVQYKIEEPVIGKWKIWYDKKDNELFEINYSSYMPELNIAKLDFVQTDMELNIEFLVSGKSKEDYDWSIFAVNTNEESKQVLLDQGHSELNKINNVSFSIDKLELGSYNLKIWVEQTTGVEEVSDYLVTDKTFNK